MSAVDMVNVCPVCGAEEGLDVLLARMFADPEVRGLIADVLNASLPLGPDLVRYLRLHKPPKQRLRLATVRRLLTEPTDPEVTARAQAIRDQLRTELAAKRARLQGDAEPKPTEERTDA